MTNFYALIQSDAAAVLQRRGYDPRNTAGAFEMALDEAWDNTLEAELRMSEWQANRELSDSADGPDDGVWRWWSI